MVNHRSVSVAVTFISSSSLNWYFLPSSRSVFLGKSSIYTWVLKNVASLTDPTSYYETWSFIACSKCLQKVHTIFRIMEHIFTVYNRSSEIDKFQTVDYIDQKVKTSICHNCPSDQCFYFRFSRNYFLPMTNHPWKFRVKVTFRRKVMDA